MKSNVDLGICDQLYKLDNILYDYVRYSICRLYKADFKQWLCMERRLPALNLINNYSSSNAIVSLWDLVSKIS